MISDIGLFFKNNRKEDILKHILNHPQDMQILKKIAVDYEDKNAWRACWILRLCSAEHQEGLDSISSELVKILPFARDNHQREILGLLARLKIKEDDEGRLFDVCMTIWEKTKIQPSVRFHAFKTILKIVEKYPEMWSEVEFLTEPHFMETLSPGVRYSIKLLLKKSKSGGARL